ncbi:NAD(P)-binding domain-containing protein [Sulfurovum sp. ST-21]|uniref:NAD(P)-binding domain-containing protein n=1 Tax=Sulfurovum indicum TaxID=2779528 RepID=A0A7M1S250_9BACT|nr:NAD(P)-binding domain-containing protein [Sulfurovum indicum]QOR61406.1 NAD(P)-binding domain-containing protein [Sulfurovum indicum]
MEKIYDLIIIGGGPGGIGSAVEAKVLGLGEVLLIEKTENHSHTIRKFYKDQKRVDKDWQGQTVVLEGNVDFFDGTKESTLDYFDALLDDEKIDTRFNCAVEKVEKHENLFYVSSGCGIDKAKNVIISIGRMGKPNKPSYKIPPSLKTKINFNLERCGSGEKVLIVGGGDSAVEYACELSSCNEVTLNYRREILSRPNPTNQNMIREYSDKNAVTLKLGVDIAGLENEHGKVKVNFTDGTELYDRVIYAIGGTTPKDFLKSCGITLDERGEPIFDENYESEVKGLYIAGDIAFKSGGSIAIALNHGFRIVNHILNKEK